MKKFLLRAVHCSRPLIIVFVLSLSVNTAESSPLRISTYNILDFPGSYGFARLDDFRTVLLFMDPDILVVQEMQSQTGVDVFLDSVMLQVNGSFKSLLFHDGPDTDNALFYRQDRVDFIGVQYLSTANRDIAAYRLLPNGSQSELYLLSVHLKASQGASNEAIRLQEATILRNFLSTLLPGTNFIVAGDFNIYHSDEPAFGMMTDSLENNAGRLFDPLSMNGNWHENSSFAAVHTQSTRVEQLPDGGVGGGLDDRFDMILCSASLLDGSGMCIVNNSYTACGNDGAHFNLSVNYGNNGSVPYDVADGLYWASDHLPLYMDVFVDTAVLIEEPVVRVWPNPMQHWAQVVFPPHDDFVSARLIMTNILGQRVYEQTTTDPLGHRIELDDLPIGVYFLHLTIETYYSDYSYEVRIAVVK
jgi:endonuclease/exonuclease/phosphatase family metal-dependent hydrolase